VGWILNNEGLLLKMYMTPQEEISHGKSTQARRLTNKGERGFATEILKEEIQRGKKTGGRKELQLLGTGLGGI